MVTSAAGHIPRARNAIRFNVARPAAATSRWMMCIAGSHAIVPPVSRMTNAVSQVTSDKE